METIQRIDQEHAKDSSQLVDRMDSAIGEASTSIGMVMSEMVRRSLRGGVAEIGSSIHDYAREQVSAAVDEIMPTVSKAVEELAETTSHRVTDEAVQKFGEELKTVETRTVEQTQVIAARYKEESEAAIAVIKVAVSESRDTVENTARDLNDLRQRAKDSWKKVQGDLEYINEARDELERRVSETGRELTSVVGKLEEERNQHRKTSERLSETCALLTNAQDQIKELTQTASDTQQSLSSTQRDLTTTREELTSTQKELSEAQQQLASTRQQLATTQQHLAETQQKLNATQQQLTSTQQQAAATQQQLISTQNQANTTQHRLDATRQELAHTQKELAIAADALSQLSRDSVRKTQQLDSICKALMSRLDELERPKGIKALFSRFSGGKKAANVEMSGVEGIDESNDLENPIV